MSYTFELLLELPDYPINLNAASFSCHAYLFLHDGEILKLQKLVMVSKGILYIVLRLSGKFFLIANDKL